MLTPFDHRKAAAELASSQSETSGPKLTTYEQCQAFAALRNHIKPAIVARAFGISRISISHLNNCLALKRYKYVRAEWKLMGEDNFLAKYYDEALHIRLAEAKHALDQARNAHAFGAPNKAAFAKASRHIGAFNPTGEAGDYYCVMWVNHKTNPKLAGWWFSPCDAEANPLSDGWSWHGLEAVADSAPKPFRTSSIAWRAAYTYCNREPPI